MLRSARRTSEGIQNVRLEDDAVHIQMVVCEAFRSGDGPLRLVLSVSERSSYPSSDGLLFVEDGGSETIEELVQEVTSGLSGDVRLHRVLRKLCEAFMVGARLPAAAVAAAAGGGAAKSAEATQAAAAAAAPMETDDNDEDEDDEDDDDDDENSDDDDDDYGYGFQEENNWENLQRTKRRWEELESKRSGKRVKRGGPMSSGRPAGDAAVAPKPTAAAAVEPKNEMFSSRESFRMLSNELFHIIEKTNAGRDAGKIISAEAVDDDVHHWKVRVGGFSGELGEDLKQVETLYGYNYVEIEFTFTPDLHPFYPPQVNIVRPRFKGWILGAVMTHPMFVLSGWDPMRSTLAVIEHVRTLLQSFGRIEVDTQRNDADAFPHSAYSPLENVLIKMELLTSTRPRAADRYPELFADRDKEVDKDRLRMFRNLSKKDEKDKAKASSKEYWASGTGYGHTGAGKGEVWDSEAAMAAQKHQDNLRAAVLQELLSVSSVGGGSAAAAVSSSGGGAAAAASGDVSLLARLASADTRDRDFVLDSCLIPFLEAEILHTTLQDMGVRFSYYTSVMQAARNCLELEWLRPHLGKLGDGLSELADQSTIFQVSVGGREFADKVAAAREADAANSGGAATAASNSTSGNLMPKGMARKPKEQSEIAGWQQMTDLLKLADAVQQVASYGKELALAPAAALTTTLRSPMEGLGIFYSNIICWFHYWFNLINFMIKLIIKLTTTLLSAAGAAGGAASSSEAEEAREVGRQYTAALDTHRFQFVTELAQIAATTAAAAASRGASGGSGRMRRLASEAASCQKNLPLDLSSACFVRVDENQINHWHALITGPEDTPYEGGCFIFDILCGPDYPNAAPKVLLFTTGGGTVRFNPNLYNCGKVCLSLLGTWSGGQGEAWDPNVSSLLQVLISIQALILVPQPFFNEPGFESKMGTPQGESLTSGKRCTQATATATAFWDVF